MSHYLTRAVAAAEGRVVPAQFEIREVEVSGTGSKQYLEGRAVPYDAPQNIGWYTEIIESGCFTKSIREAANGLPLLLFHDSSSLDAHIGKAERWIEESDGLHGVWRLHDSESAQRAAKMAEDQILAYMSVGFQPVRSTSQFDDDDNLTIIRHEARLLETSLVSTPAFPTATVTKVRTTTVEMSEQVAGRRIKGWQEYLDTVRT